MVNKFQCAEQQDLSGAHAEKEKDPVIFLCCGERLVRGAEREKAQHRIILGKDEDTPIPRDTHIFLQAEAITSIRMTVGRAAPH